MKITKYGKYDMAFEQIVDCIAECNLIKMANINKSLARINDLVEKEYPMKVEYNHVARNYQGELEYDEPSCPSCSLGLELNEEYSYCPFCGQRISWEIGE